MAKSKNAPLGARDVQALLANALADDAISARELKELFIVYVTFGDQMTAEGRDILYKVLSPHIEETADRLGFKAKDATDLFYVYHHQRDQMTADAKQEMLDFLSKFFP